MASTPVRLEDIARRAGVSRNTVSVALRNKPGVSDERRTQILRIAEEMGYRPNPMIAALMHNLRATRPATATNNIAFLHYFKRKEDWKARLYCAELFEGVAAQCSRSGYAASVVWGAEPGLNPHRLGKMLLSRGVSGLILAPMPDGRRHVHLPPADFAIATVGYSLWRPALDRACSHMRHAVVTAVRQLRRLGYRRIGLAWHPDADARKEYAASAGYATVRAIHEELLCTPFFGNAHLSDRFPRWLEREQPDAIVNAGSHGMRDRLGRIGYAFPRDLGYVELVEDDAEEAGIATMVRDWRMIGAGAVDLVTTGLMQNLRGLPGNRRTVLVEGRWNPGRSVRRQG